jgi:hypothetical protein
MVLLVSVRDLIQNNNKVGRCLHLVQTTSTSMPNGSIVVFVLFTDQKISSPRRGRDLCFGAKPVIIFFKQSKPMTVVSIAVITVLYCTR